MASPSLGVALGSGGARGFAHIPYIEAIDELGLTPVHVAGASIGALLGAGWCSGMSGAELREYATRVTTLREITARVWASGQAVPRRFGVQVDPLGIVGAYLPDGFPDAFEALAIPFTAVTTDFFRGEQQPLSSGPLRHAIAASLAIPGVFLPQRIGDRVYIDGGTVNPLPVDQVRPRADVVVAIDVNGHLDEPPAGAADPTPFDIIFGATQMMSRTIARNALRQYRPEIFVDAPVWGMRALEFWRAAELLERVTAEKDSFKRRVTSALEAAARAK